MEPHGTPWNPTSHGNPLDEKNLRVSHCERRVLKGAVDRGPEEAQKGMEKPWSVCRLQLAGESLVSAEAKWEEFPCSLCGSKLTLSGTIF